MSGDDVTALANELRFTLRLGLIQPDSVARSILASAWRIQRDARIRAEAWDEGKAAAHKALGAPFVWFAPENPYRADQIDGGAR